MDKEIFQLLITNTADVLKILGPAIITGVVGYFAGKAQLEIKIHELEKSNEFKAKEKIFDYLKEKLSKSHESLAELEGSFGQIAGMSDEDDTYEDNKFIYSQVANYVENLPYEIRNIRKGLNSYKENYTDELELVDKLEENYINIKVPTDHETLLNTINELIKAHRLIIHCFNALVENQAMQIMNHNKNEA